MVWTQPKVLPKSPMGTQVRKSLESVMGRAEPISGGTGEWLPGAVLEFEKMQHSDGDWEEFEFPRIDQRDCKIQELLRRGMHCPTRGAASFMARSKGKARLVAGMPDLKRHSLASYRGEGLAPQTCGQCYTV